jgi:hypothetical protein
VAPIATVLGKATHGGADQPRPAGIVADDLEPLGEVHHRLGCELAEREADRLAAEAVRGVEQRRRAWAVPRDSGAASKGNDRNQRMAPLR